MMDAALEAMHIFGADLHSLTDDLVTWQALSSPGCCVNKGGFMKHHPHQQLTFDLSGDVLASD